MTETYEQWRERMARNKIPDPPVVFAGRWARKRIEDLEAEVERLTHGMCDALDDLQCWAPDALGTIIIRGLLVGTAHEGNRDAEKES